jgi:hypothetical protein
MEFQQSIPRYKSNTLFSTDEEDLVNMQFQSGDEITHTLDHQKSKKKKKISRKAETQSEEWTQEKENITGFTFEEYQSLFVMENKSVFKQLLKEENADLFKQFEKDEIEFEVKVKVNRESPSQRFSRIDKNVKKSLSGDMGSKLIHQLEKELTVFMKDPKEDTLAILFQDPFCRLLGHGICRYYTLSSTSVNTKDGRVTIIRKTKNTSNPDLLLSEFLNTSKDDFDYMDVQIQKVHHRKK